MSRAACRVIAVDVGGSNVRAALFEGVERRGEVVVRPTPEGAGEVLDAICDAVRAVAILHGLKPGDVRAVGVGFPGVFDPVRGVSVQAGNLRGWRGGPVAGPLEARLGWPVAVDNDVRAGAYGELRAGAATDVDDVVYVSIGTGVGGAVFVGGRPYLGSGFAAGELGHMVLDASAEGAACRCGQTGHVEALLSGYAIEAAAQAVTGRRWSASEALLAGREGAPGLDGLYRSVVRYLALFLATAAAALAPQRIVVGGGLGTHPAYPVEAACDALQRLAPAWVARDARVVRARLGPWSGLTGAAVLALRRAGCEQHASSGMGGSM